MSQVRPFPPEGVNTGAANVPDSDRSPTEGAAGLRNDLVASLARVLVSRFKPVNLDHGYRQEMAAKCMPLPDAVDESSMVGFVAADGHLSIRPLTFGEIADAVLADGFRRVVDDDDTVWKVAFMIAATDGWDITRPGPGGEPTPTAMRFLILARAAVRALREET